MSLRWRGTADPGRVEPWRPLEAGRRAVSVRDDSGSAEAVRGARDLYLGCRDRPDAVPIATPLHHSQAFLASRGTGGLSADGYLGRSGSRGHMFRGDHSPPPACVTAVPG